MRQIQGKSILVRVRRASSYRGLELLGVNLNNYYTIPYLKPTSEMCFVLSALEVVVMVEGVVVVAVEDHLVRHLEVVVGEVEVLAKRTN